MKPIVLFIRKLEDKDENEANQPAVQAMGNHFVGFLKFVLPLTTSC